MTSPLTRPKQLKVMASGTTESEVDLLENLQRKTLKSCHDILAKKLDVSEVYPLMNQKDLLADEDKHFLLVDTGKSTIAKVNYIIEMLPRKEEWWDKFIDCLRESTSGTAHKLLASTLTSRLKRLIYEYYSRDKLTADPQSVHDIYNRTHAYHDSAHASGISQDMNDFMLVAMADHTELQPVSNKPKSPDIAKLRPDLAGIITPIVQLKNKLDDISVRYKIVGNQIGLLQAFDELLKNTKRFSDALSGLLKLYIDKFKAKQRDNYLQLTTVEQKVIQIIEDITEGTEDIDIDKERKVWEQCILTIKKSCDVVKEALYSQETSEMVKSQEIFKLDGAEAEAAKEWIAVRKQVVILGNKSLVKLDELRSQDDALITSVYDTVKKRVQVGDECLKAWTNWVDQRIKLAS